MSEKLKIGAVIYAPQVTVIWGIIADFFEKEGFPIEPVYFKDYKGQVDALLNNEIDVAWNSPLAWLDGYLRSGGKTLNGAMRDTDQDRQSYLVVNDPTIQSIEDLKNKTIAFGAIDSPQARLIPIEFLHQHGLEFGQDYVEKRFDAVSYTHLLRNVHIPKSISDFEQARLRRLDRVYVLVAKGKSPLRLLLPLLSQHESHPVKVAPSSAFPGHHHKDGHPRFYACRM